MLQNNNYFTTNFQMYEKITLYNFVFGKIQKNIIILKVETQLYLGFGPRPMN